MACIAFAFVTFTSRQTRFFFFFFFFFMRTHCALFCAHLPLACYLPLPFNRQTFARRCLPSYHSCLVVPGWRYPTATYTLPIPATTPCVTPWLCLTRFIYATVCGRLPPFTVSDTFACGYIYLRTRFTHLRTCAHFPVCGFARAAHARAHTAHCTAARALHTTHLRLNHMVVHTPLHYTAFHTAHTRTTHAWFGLFTTIHTPHTHTRTPPHTHTCTHHTATTRYTRSRNTATSTTLAHYARCSCRYRCGSPCLQRIFLATRTRSRNAHAIRTITARSL